MEYPSTLCPLTTFVCDLPCQVRPSSCARHARHARDPTHGACQAVPCCGGLARFVFARAARGQAWNGANDRITQYAIRRSAPIGPAQALRAIKLMRIARMTRLISRFQYRLKLNPAYLRLGVTVRRPCRRLVPCRTHGIPRYLCGIRRALRRCAADVSSPLRPV